MRRGHSIRLSVAALLAALAFATGCSDTCTCPDDADEIGYPDQSTPANVIEKLEMAYEAMDAGACMECLAEDFIFYLNPEDLVADPTLPDYWGKMEERPLHENMFAPTGAIESISLTVTVISADSLPGDDPADPSDDLWEYDTHVDLRIESGLPYFAAGRVVFVMRRAPDREETTWQIAEQHDLIEAPEWIQSMTWTRIKLSFGGVDEDSLYPTRSSPENVLDKLVSAYQRMDAEAYLDCLAEDLLFFLNPDDVTEDPTLPEHWDKVEEAIIHGNMFGEDTDIELIELITTHESVVWDDGGTGDPLDDLWTYTDNIDLRVHLPQDLILHAHSPCEFTLGIDPHETGHGGRLLWEITTWYDLDEETGRKPYPMHGPTSWGTIKAMYR